MRIQHNIPAMNSYRNFTTNNSKLNKNLEKLSSGYAINRAGDDAAGLAISEKMRAQITGLEVAQKNAKDGISVVQTAEGALTEVHDMLNRMYSLAEQSANGIYSSTERQKLQDEVDQLTDEINRIADSTNFNGINLLNGDLAAGTGTGSGSMAVSGIKADHTQIIRGTQAKYTSNNLTIDQKKAAKLTTGATMTMKFKYTDSVGKEQTYSVSLTIAGNSSNKATYTTSTGRTGTVNIGATLATGGLDDAATSSGAVVAKAFEDAIISAGTDDTANNIKGDAFYESFQVQAQTGDTNNGAIKFSSKVNGSSGAQFAYGSDATGAIVFSAVDKSGNTIIESTDLTQKSSHSDYIEKGIDRTTAYELHKDNVWDITNRNDMTADKLNAAAFSVGGKRFVMITSTAAAAEAANFVSSGEVVNAGIQSLLKDNNIDGYVVLSTAGQVQGADATKMVEKIKEVTGLDIQQGNVTYSSATDQLNNTTSDVQWTKAANSKAFVIVGSNASNSNTASAGGLVLQIGDTAESFNRLSVNIDDMHAKALFGASKLDMVDNDNAAAQQKSQKVMDTIKTAIDKVSTTRGNLGALQNRLEHTINNLSTTRENLQDAESSIRDVDVAEEMMRYTKNNIMNQSAQAMLAQANQLPQGVLQLLQ